MAGEADVRMRFFGNEADAERAIVSLEKKYDDLLNKVNQVAKQSKKGGQETTGMLGEAAKAVDGMIDNFARGGAIVATFTTLVASLKKEIEQLEESNRRAGQTQVPYAAAAREALINMSSQAPADFHDRVQQISRNTGVNPRDIAVALSNASSAQGTLEDERTFDTTEKVLRFIPDVIEAQPALSVAAMDIQRLEQNADAEDAIGFLNAVGKRVHVASQKDIGENIAPAIIDMAREGTDFRSSAAIVAAITQGMNDPRGARSRTAATALDTQLRAAFPAIKGGTDEIIRFLQDNPAEAAKFMENASFELAAKGTMNAILTKGSSVALDMEGAFAEMPELTDSEAFYRQGLSRLEGDPVLRNAAIQRAIESANQRGLLANLVGGESAITKEGINDFLANNGIGFIERQFFSGSMTAESLQGESGLDTAIGVLSSAREERVMGGGLTAWIPNMFDSERSERELKAFDDMIGVLQDIKANTQQQRNRNANGE